MKERQSESAQELFLLEDAEAFAHHAKEIVAGARRELAILGERLDSTIYDQPLAELISRLARADRNARVRILLKDIQPITERGHALLDLARRLSSKVEIRKLLIEPENETEAFLVADRLQVLYQHSDGDYTGFANYQAGPEAAKLLDTFDHLWERHGEISPALRRLHI
jgi:hypothetical protein